MFWGKPRIHVMSRIAALAVFLIVPCLILTAGTVSAQEIETNEDMKTDETDVRSQAPDSILAYYFHRTYRCVRCITMEAYVLAVLHLNYSSDLKKEALRWHAIDFEDPANIHYAGKYELEGPALVLSHWKDGEETRWMVVDEIWGLLDTPGALVGCIDRNIKACLAGEYDRGKL